MIPDFYTFQNDHHDKSNCPLSPYKVLTLLLTVFSTLYTSYPMTHVFCNLKFTSLCFPHLFLSCIPSSLAVTYWFSESVIPFLFGYTCSFVSVFRVHLYVKAYRICLSFYFWLCWNHIIFVFLSFCMFIPGCAGSLCCVRAFSSCSEQGILFVVEHGLEGHRLQ